MIGINRALGTLVAAAAAGCVLWLAAQIGRGSNGGYWAAYAVVAAAGVVLGLSQLRGREGNPPAMFAIAFVPVAIAAGWVLVGHQPQPSWLGNHVLAWSSDAGLQGVVHDVGTWLGAIALGVGLVLGLTFEPFGAGVLARRRRAAAGMPLPPAPTGGRTTVRTPSPADEPLMAERRAQLEEAPREEVRS